MGGGRGGLSGLNFWGGVGVGWGVSTVRGGFFVGGVFGVEGGVWGGAGFKSSGTVGIILTLMAAKLLTWGGCHFYGPRDHYGSESTSGVIVG